MEQAPHSTRRRTLQACKICRRRKTKCDGTKPRCRQCRSRNADCSWDESLGGLDVREGGRLPHSLSPASVGHVAYSPDSSPFSAHQPNISLRRSFDLFYEIYLQTVFCSFLHKSTYEKDPDKTPFLTSAIICLVSRHLKPSEVQEDFGLATGADLCQHYTTIANDWAKGSIFTPSVVNIQANLVLALSELLNRSGSSHWMLAGTAIRMAQIMRLNKEYHERTSEREQEIRRRTFWACVMIDRLFGFILTKPLAIFMDSTAVYLPSSEAGLLYEEASRGLTLSALESFSGLSSDVGILPYFVKTVVLWGDHCIFYICNKRFIDPLPPTDSNSAFFKSHYALCNWETALPASMRWTARNYEIQSSIGNGHTFVAMHFLIRSSHCVAHQTYLPHLDGTTIILDSTDAAGWSLLFREPTLASTCVENALLVGKMLTDLYGAGGISVQHLQSAWVAASLLSVASTFMWILYANDAEFSTEQNKSAVEGYLELIQRLLVSWKSDHRLVRAWIKTIDDMHSIYRAAYLGQVPVESDENLDSSENETLDVSAEFRPQSGDGFVPLSTARDIHSVLRLIMGDSTANRPMARSVWMLFIGMAPLVGRPY
ncbi:hypothetical protein V2G26_013235 [Clonostachys chloroleuca]